MDRSKSRKIAEAAFCADDHPLLDKYLAAKGIDAEREGYGVDLAELITFAECLSPDELREVR